MSQPLYLDHHTLIVGASGAGKTVTAKQQVEQLLTAGRHVAIVDPTSVWHGLRADADGEGPGFPIPIFGGANGDVPITAEQGAKVGEIIASGVSAIVDLSAMDSTEQQEFVDAMIAVLRRKPRGNFHLVVDEADEFAPQTSPSKAGEAAKRQMEWIAKRGRVQGFVLTAITQRPADIAKSVISQMQTVIAHQLIAPADQDAVRAYLKANAPKATISTVMESLAGLKRGERWIYSPRLGILERGISPLPRTFDSSRTPEPGEHPIEPKMLAEIDLGAIKQQLAPVDKSGENSGLVAPDASPRDWATVDLIDELDRRDPEWFKAHPEYVAAIKDRDHFQRGFEDYRDRVHNARRALGIFNMDELDNEDFEKSLQPARISPAQAANAGGHDEVTSKPALPKETVRPDPKPASGRIPENPPSPGKPDYPPRWQRILDALAWSRMMLKRDHVERNIVAWFADASPKSSGFQNDLGAMRTAGYIEYPSPGFLTLTPLGGESAHWPKRAPTRDDLLDAIKRRLEPRFHRILDAVCAANSPLNRAELAETIGVSAASSGFQNDLGKLRTLGLIDYPRSGLVWVGKVLQ